MTTNNSATNLERLIELSLAPKEYSGKATNYIPTEVSVSSLEKTFKSHNYSPIHWSGNYRLAKNFIKAVGFCLDIDDGMTIDEALIILKQHNLNFALVTTRSHKSEKHRFRILIPFNQFILSLEHYKRSAQALNELFSAKCDSTVFDGARQLFGSPDDAIYYDNWSGVDFEVTSFISNDNSLDILPHLNIEKGGKEQITDSWDDSTVLKRADGHNLYGNEITEKTRLFCPFHKDETPSAFADYSEKSNNWYIHCKSCGQTFWKTELTNPLEERCAPYWSHTSKIYEMGIIGDAYHFKEIGEKKFQTFVEAKNKQSQSEAYEWLLKHHHISNVQRIDYLGDPLAASHTFEVKKDEGLIEVKYRALPVEIQDNQFIENYLDSVFGQSKDFIKQYMAVYTYTDFKKLPTLILIGVRGVGKNKFAEMLSEIYPQRSQFWTASEESFNPELQKKLLIADETVSGNKKNYQYLKRLSGQSCHVINEKFTPKYQVKNNVNVIILSNNLLPIFVEREELPTDPANNQFFVYEIKPFTGTLDAELDKKLKARLGHYVRTELKSVFDGLDLSKYRYSIPVPITQEERKLFRSSVSLEQMNADKFIEELVNKITETPPWNLTDHVTSGFVPIDTLCKELQITNQDKRAIVHNLRERDYISSDDTQRPMIAGKKPYCYLMTEKLKDKIETDGKIVCFARKAREQQAKKAA
jgi:hypothetical protein